jgi:ribonucleoside-diphosphate reductase alpha chain
MNQYQEYIHLSRYARWKDDAGRRETWDETVSRYVNFFKNKHPEFPQNEIKDAIKSMKVMPSMRALMTAGKALERDNVAGYNCSYIAVDHPRAFDEIMYVLMCGTGAGFSVERQFVSKLPSVPDEFRDSDTTIVVADSKIGWASAYKELINLLFAGAIPKWDISKVRPSGARLKTFGGRASGPAPLVDLFKFTINVFKHAAGRKLSSIECHDIVCKIADIVVVGGVRRSALISLSNLSDDRMRNAKNGQWWVDNVQRALANNSAAYTEKPDVEIFLKEWLSLIESKSGERGIVNRQAIQKKIKDLGVRDSNQEFGLNPCAEIFLRPSGFCNLSEVIIREEDSLEDLKEKVRLATIVGTFQSTLTEFRYLRPVWKKNAEEERLLGVSMTGIMQHPVLSKVSDEAVRWLKELKQVSLDTNAEWADKLGINRSAAITCVKPSGTVSELTQTSSGIHPKYADFYVRTVRGSNDDPITKLMKDQGVPNEPDVTKPEKTTVFSFPVFSGTSGVSRDDMTAIEQLEHQKMFNEHWCDHNVSITVYVRDDEWLEVGSWIYKNWNKVYATSFLPHSDHVYAQAPFQEISKDEFEKMAEEFPIVDWSELANYEKEDQTESTQTLACTGGVCSII